MNRLTVVLDDDDLYRRLKVRGAEDGVPMKALVEQALIALLDQPEGQPHGAAHEKEWDWQAFDRWQEQIREAEAKAYRAYPPDLSDVKKYLYGEDRRVPALMIAEEPAEYDPR